MRVLLVSMLGVVASTSLGVSCRSTPERERVRFGPFEFSAGFKSGEYLEAAQRIQSLGEAVAVTRLREWCREYDRRDPFDSHHSPASLCRMLFEARPGAPFRRPGLGGASFLADTSYEDWPLEPITLVNGTPFEIVEGYVIGGQPESATGYLEYCIANCQWRVFLYEPPLSWRLRDDLAALVSSPKWRRPLNGRELWRLLRQIEDIDPLRTSR
jgi:hypothetical protein